MKMLKYITQQLSKLLAVYIVVLIMILLICTPLLEYDEVRCEQSTSFIVCEDRLTFRHILKVDRSMEAIATSLSSHGAVTPSEVSEVVEGFFNFYKNETDFVLYRVDTGNVTVRCRKV